MSDESANETTAAESESLYSSARAKSFIDAVVAIAMTLLILPLVDSLTVRVSTSTSQPDAATWFTDHTGLLFGFGVSFVIIALFWIQHHRMYARVHTVTNALLWLNVAWLATIVWLPVTTAMSDEMDNSDALSIAVYVGSMALTSVLALVQRLYLRTHRGLHQASEAALRSGIAVDLSMVTLFLLSMAVAILFSAINYYALFLLMLTGPLQRLYGRLLHVPTDRRHERG